MPDEGTTIRIHLPYIPYEPEKLELLENGKMQELKGERAMKKNRIYFGLLILALVVTIVWTSAGMLGVNKEEKNTVCL